MKKLTYLIGLFLLGSCSAVSVTDSWSNEDVSSLVGEKIEVIAKTSDNTNRSRIEADMVNSLNAAGFKATSSFKSMEKIDPDKKISDQETEAIKKELLDQGFNLVLMIVLKDKEQYLKSNSTYDSYGTPGFYGGGYYRGFGAYYGSMNTWGTSSTTTEVAKKYIVETVIYDLSKPAGKSLLAAVTTDIDDPTSLSKTSADLAEKVVAEFMKPSKSKK